MKIALSFSASIDAGVAAADVVNVCSVMSKRRDGAGGYNICREGKRPVACREVA